MRWFDDIGMSSIWSGRGVSREIYIRVSKTREKKKIGLVSRMLISKIATMHA
jgi:hypothetical protein